MSQLIVITQNEVNRIIYADVREAVEVGHEHSGRLPPRKSLVAKILATVGRTTPARAETRIKEAISEGAISEGAFSPEATH